jgi:hypothetical protein
MGIHCELSVILLCRESVARSYHMQQVVRYKANKRKINFDVICHVKLDWSIEKE